MGPGFRSTSVAALRRICGPGPGRGGKRDARTGHGGGGSGSCGVQGGEVAEGVAVWVRPMLSSACALGHGILRPDVQTCSRMGGTLLRHHEHNAHAVSSFPAVVSSLRALLPCWCPLVSPRLSLRASFGGFGPICRCSPVHWFGRSH